MVMKRIAVQLVETKSFHFQQVNKPIVVATQTVVPYPVFELDRLYR